MTPDQVQKDLELVLDLAEERAIAVSDILPSKGIFNAQQAISRLRALKLVAVEEGKHAYFSRFKPGDEVWEVFNPVVGGFREHRVSKKSRTVAAVSGDGVIFLKWNRDWTFVKEQNLFPTRDAAQAECDKRNTVTVDENGKVEG